jgi:hypothetical protein
MLLFTSFYVVKSAEKERKIGVKKSAPARLVESAQSKIRAEKSTVSEDIDDDEAVKIDETFLNFAAEWPNIRVECSFLRLFILHRCGN